MGRTMNQRTLGLTALIACLGLGPAQSFAHHSYSQFDSAKCQSLEGTVNRVEWTYPHAWLWVNVTDTKGVVTPWGFEGASPVVLQRVGWTRSTLKEGDKVSVRYSPLKDGRHGGSFASVKLSDGRELLGGSPACSPRK
jgi:hypothetical protein